MTRAVCATSGTIPMTELTIVCWLWSNENDKLRERCKFTPEHANILHDSLQRNMSIPFNFVCITDIPDDPAFTCPTLPLWDDHKAAAHPYSSGYVNCYRRLKIFDKETAESFGTKYIMSLDLDTVILGDLAPLLSKYDSPFVGYRIKMNTRPLTYNGSMFLFEAGHPETTILWDRFDSVRGPAYARLFGYRGSDQAWISYVLSNKYPYFSTDDGVWAYRRHLRQQKTAPQGCLMIHYFGRHNPWQADQSAHDWITEHYRAGLGPP